MMKNDNRSRRRFAIGTWRNPIGARKTADIERFEPDRTLPEAPPQEVRDAERRANRHR